MNSQIALITDSSCDLPQELIEQYDIGVIPLGVVWGEKVYRDRVDLTPEEFYARLEHEKSHPSSTLPSPADGLAAFSNAIARGAKEIVAVILRRLGAITAGYITSMKPGK